ncbi:MAG: hypothetical protein CMK83_14315 [Pseudomonadales bacterium]|jgi:uncharacterized protein|uniref:YhcB family protein n=1 Tax=unclassified Ketobacter TaxID=2639109 RepID=UPI000C4E1A03|nr:MULTISPECIES: DUF1043 family protein [unclassified Ketobacter]MAA59770.1 hypothetical protein [Pseudomonadales bacterium]MEC8811092.1 DUF1043 family protein [Pseudomonadota bacterium]TNC83523.1 MAG: hypothetical protein CSH49_21050 [Alcanivorax sp.]HAG95730.1 hypothetical protein [Gammaproteobacteria bacterium]MAQ25378.1 hypothetical protein [Pseudomonadales bacterium]|tara:strand:- start:23392 stop:23871 length:480 start_codon:yes stop_codon:yes gene_type:complete
MYTATLIAFLVGLTAGALGCFLLMSRSRAQSNIEQQLRELQEEFTAYRENVNTHFNKTAQMVNTLTENYLAVQKHLETAADSFAEPPKSFQLDTTQKLPNKKTKFISLEATGGEAQQQEEDAAFGDTNTMEPPRDYAPKKDVKDQGTLSEEFGLHDSRV